MPLTNPPQKRTPAELMEIKTQIAKIDEVCQELVAHLEELPRAWRIAGKTMVWAIMGFVRLLVGEK